MTQTPDKRGCERCGRPMEKDRPCEGSNFTLPCYGAMPAVKHDENSPCIDPADRVACDWEFDAGDDSVGVPWCWNCKTCGCVDINRDPPSDPDADAYERNQ